MNIDLQVPIWTIEHVAAAFHTSVDTAREHTYCADFPAPKAPFAKNLWEREAVLNWFAGLPARGRSTRNTKSATRAGTPAQETASPARAATAHWVDSTTPPQKAIKSYKPRTSR